MRLPDGPRLPPELRERAEAEIREVRMRLGRPERARWLLPAFGGVLAGLAAVARVALAEAERDATPENVQNARVLLRERSRALRTCGLDALLDGRPGERLQERRARLAQKLQQHARRRRRPCDAVGAAAVGECAVGQT